MWRNAVFTNTIAGLLFEEQVSQLDLELFPQFLESVCGELGDLFDPQEDSGFPVNTISYLECF